MDELLLKFEDGLQRKLSPTEIEVLEELSKEYTNEEILDSLKVRNGKVVQARTRFNQEPPVEAMNTIRKWEQTLIPIMNSEDKI